MSPGTTSTMLSPRSCVAVLTLLFFIASAVGSEEVITTISGRHVPIDLVQQHFVNKLSSSAKNDNVLYELNDHVLRGSDLFLDLTSDVLPVRAERTLAAPTVTLNGVTSEFSSASLRTVRVKSYSVIIDDETDHVQAITGNGIVLTPLHPSKFPGVFVNKMALSDPRYDLATDLRIIGKAPNHRVSGVSNPETVKNAEFLHRETDVNTDGHVTTRQAGGSCAGGTTHYLEIAVAYDNTLCALYDNKENVATKALQEVIDKANGAYATNTCIQLVLVHVEAHCDDQNDPYKGFSRFSPGQILNNFQQIWIRSRDNIKRDSAYLVTGFQDGTSVAGVAYIAAACSNRNGYGWVEGLSAVIFAHEVGHTLGGQHTRSGIMGPVATGGTLPSFSAESVQQFTKYVDDYPGSGCIETSRSSGAPRGTSPPATTAAQPRTPAVPEEPSLPRTNPPSNEPPVVNEPTGGSGGKCKSGFTSSNALSCSNQRLRVITFSGGGAAVGTFQTSLQQRSGRFIVRYRVTEQLYISRYRDVVTTDRGLLGSSKGDFKTPRGSAKKVNSAWIADQMPKPAGETTCCGNNLYIATDVTVCIKTPSGMELCQTISETYTTRITCTNACRGNPGGAFTAMSADQECPSCT